MKTESIWYSDPDLVLGELRNERDERTREPGIRGYTDLCELQRGGQGVVYLATQASTGRRVAVKVLLEGVYASRTSRRRFEREIELVSSLRHPNIVRVYDSGSTSDGRLYFVMEYIEGVPLDEHVRNQDKSKSRKVETADLLHLFAEICEAINFAHQRGVIHRDLKPSNIRIDPEGRPHVLDFGLAKIASGDSEENVRSISLTGQFMGSLPWASPEQVRGRNSQIDIRSDVYSLGVMMYQMLTGTFPYGVDGHLRDVMENILRVEPAPLRAAGFPLAVPGGRGRNLGATSAGVHPAARFIDDEIETIVLKCLQKEPERRYQAAGEVARDIRRYLAGEPIDAKRDSAWYVLRKTARRYRLAVMVTGTLVVLAIAFAATVTVLYQRARTARESEAAARITAEGEAEKARQVQQFLQSMLATVDPYWAQGRDVGVLRELLDEAARRIGDSGATPPQVEAAIRATLGQTYLGLGMREDAKAHLQAALGLRRRTLGEEHPDTFASRVDWSTWLLDGPGTDEARRFIADSLESSRRVMGEDDAHTLLLNLNWAYFLHARGELAESEAEYRRTLASLRRALGPENENTIKAANNFSVLLQDLGRWEEAEALIREVADTQRRTRGAEHSDTLLALNNLASVLSARGRYAEAEALQRETLAITRRVFGERHPRTLSNMGNLADTLQHNGRLEEAESLGRRTLDLRMEVLGEESELTAQSLNNLARVLQEQKRWAEAEPLMRRTVDLATRVFGPEHMHTLIAMNTLAGNLEELGRAEEAEPLYRSTLEIQRRTLGAAHPTAITTMNNLAGLLRDHGRPGEAEVHYREVLSLTEKALPEGHWLRYVFQGGLGRSLSLLGRYEEAERELLASYEGLKTAMGGEHERTRAVSGFIAELYKAWGKPERAAGFQLSAEEAEGARSVPPS